METVNYNLFSFIESNREISTGLVKRLKESIVKIGYIKSRPIIVNSKYKVLDGQHRLVACMELGIPVIYDIHDNGATDSEIISNLNMNQSIWRLQDFVEHYAILGVNFHKCVLELEEAYHLGITNSIDNCALDSRASKRNQAIRNGFDLALNPERFIISDFIVSCNDLYFYKTSHFNRSIFALFKKANKDQIAKVYKNRLIITQQASMQMYLTVFENIINKGNRSGVIIKLT